MWGAVVLLGLFTVGITSPIVAQSEHPTCNPYPSFPWNSASSYATLLSQYPTMIQANGTYQWTMSGCLDPSIPYEQAVEACSARSMRLCGATEIVQPSCSVWTATHCISATGDEYRIQISSEGKRECKDPAASTAMTVSCCIDQPVAPQCRSCPSGTFPKPLSTRYANERGLSLCSAGNTRPNFLFVIADDLKYFRDEREMNVLPNLRRLAEERGVSFNNAHAQMAMCSPSRSSFLTSLRPDMTKSYKISDPTRPRNMNVFTITQMFKKAGYYAFGVGKIFDGRSSGGREDQDSPDSWSERVWSPVALVWSSDRNTTNCGYGDQSFQLWTNPRPFSQCTIESESNSTVLPRYLPDEHIFASAVKKLKEFNANPRPFFVAVGLLRPHLPFVAPQRHYLKWERSQFPFNETIHGTRGPIFAQFAYNNDEPRTYTDFTGTSLKDARPPLSVFQRFSHGYYASSSYVDEIFGRLMDELDRLENIAKNTIVVFFGDHGFHLGDHMFYGKKTVYEEATHVPFVILGPKRLIPRQGLRIISPVELLDIAPTLYDLALIPHPKVVHGNSLVPLFRADQPVAQIKAVAMSQFYSFNQLKLNGMSYSLRGTRYRYVVHIFRPTRQVLQEQLFDYETDPHELVSEGRTNLQLMNSFRALFRKYLRSMGMYKLEISSGNFTRTF